MPEVYVAAGSNVEPRAATSRARSRSCARAFPGVRFSPWYRNRAVGFEGDDFINLVAGFSTELPLDGGARRAARDRDAVRARRATRRAGRRARWTWTCCCTATWCARGRRDSLPRPDLLKRAYMLGPLAALAPGVVHPTAQRHHRGAVAALRPGRAPARGSCRADRVRRVTSRCCGRRPRRVPGR